MFSYTTSSLSGVPTGTFDMSAVFAPFFSEIAVGVSLGILMLVFLTAIYDIWWTQRQIQQPPAVEEKCWLKAA